MHLIVTKLFSGEVASGLLFRKMRRKTSDGRRQARSYMSSLLLCLAFVPLINDFATYHSTHVSMMNLPRLVCLLWACKVAVSRSYMIKPGTWNFRGHPIAYEAASSIGTQKDQTPVLLLNGFGVGSFHQHRLIHELLGDDHHTDRPIYCIDYLGQGRLGWLTFRQPRDGAFRVHLSNILWARRADFDLT